MARLYNIDTNVLVSADANFLITGDRDFSEVQTLGNTTIISVSLFKRLVCDIQE
jgi:predicted nucleic acid-binding protein